jgi:hypothetical protein
MLLGIRSGTVLVSVRYCRLGLVDEERKIWKCRYKYHCTLVIIFGYSSIKGYSEY